MYKWRLRAWGLHQQQHFGKSCWGDDYERKLELHTHTHLSFVSQQCKLQVWGRYVRTPSKFSLASSYLGLEMVLVLAYCSLKKIENSKKMRGDAMVTILSSHQQNAMVSTLSVLLLTLNKALPGGHPRITRFVLLLISHWIKLNYASCFLYLSLYALHWMCVAKHIHRRFKLSMVIRLKSLLQST